MKTIDQCVTNIQEFATKNKHIYVDDGECGFGRECVGFITNGGNYVD